jgi:hypothetical protein
MIMADYGRDHQARKARAYSHFRPGWTRCARLGCREILTADDPVEMGHPEPGWGTPGDPCHDLGSLGGLECRKCNRTAGQHKGRYKKRLKREARLRDIQTEIALHPPAVVRAGQTWLCLLCLRVIVPGHLIGLVADERCHAECLWPPVKKPGPERPWVMPPGPLKPKVAAAGNVW